MVDHYEKILLLHHLTSKGTQEVKWEKSNFFLSYLPISLIYLPFPRIWPVNFATHFFLIFHVFDTLQATCIRAYRNLTMKKYNFLRIFAVAHGVQVIMGVNTWEILPTYLTLTQKFHISKNLKTTDNILFMCVSFWCIIFRSW